MKSKIFNKRNILTFIVFFMIFFISKIIRNKFFGGAYAASRAYSWDRIIDELPLNFQLSVVYGVLLTVLFNKERNK